MAKYGMKKDSPRCAECGDEGHVLHLGLCLGCSEEMLALVQDPSPEATEVLTMFGMDLLRLAEEGERATEARLPMIEAWI